LHAYANDVASIVKGGAACVFGINREYRTIYRDTKEENVNCYIRLWMKELNEIPVERQR
jgi:hypothetical protein